MILTFCFYSSFRSWKKILQSFAYSWHTEQKYEAFKDFIDFFLPPKPPLLEWSSVSSTAWLNAGLKGLPPDKMLSRAVQSLSHTHTRAHRSKRLSHICTQWTAIMHINHPWDMQAALVSDFICICSSPWCLYYLQLTLKLYPAAF